MGCEIFCSYSASSSVAVLYSPADYYLRQVVDEIWAQAISKGWFACTARNVGLASKEWSAHAAVLKIGAKNFATAVMTAIVHSREDWRVHCELHGKDIPWPENEDYSGYDSQYYA